MSIGRKRNASWTVLLAIMASLSIGGCNGPLSSFEKKTLNPGLRSQATPADVGLKFDRVSVVSSDRKLDGFVVRAEGSCPSPRAAVLLFHGRNETVADWIGVQKYLHDRCVSSLIFDYTGHGRSSPGGTVGHLNQDAVAAAQFFARTFSADQRRCFISHSMGGGPMLYAAVNADFEPDCVVMASPFSSLRGMAVLGGLPKLFAFVMPDVWDNVGAVKGVSAPLMWVHSRADTTIPIAFGKMVYDTKSGFKTAVVVDGFSHNAIYDELPDAIWLPIIKFVQGVKSDDPS